MFRSGGGAPPPNPPHDPETLYPNPYTPIPDPLPPTILNPYPLLPNECGLAKFVHGSLG
jgi:hypothetical protein